MKKLRNFKQFYLAAAYKLSLVLLKQPECANEICLLSTKKMLSDLEIDNDVEAKLFEEEYKHFCQLIWQDVTALIEFYLKVEHSSSMNINARLRQEQYIQQADKVYSFIISNQKSTNNDFSDLSASLLGRIHYQDHVKRYSWQQVSK